MDKKAIKQILTEVKELLETHGWCKSFYATDNMGNAVMLQSPDAACFCITGAIKRVMGMQGNVLMDYADGPATRLYYEIDDMLSYLLPDRTIHCTLIGYNDAKNTTKQDIIKLLENGINSCDTDI